MKKARSERRDATLSLSISAISVPRRRKPAAKYFTEGPVMFAAAAEDAAVNHNDRGDAYCGMLNCSYNLALRNIRA